MVDAERQLADATDKMFRILKKMKIRLPPSMDFADVVQHVLMEFIAKQGLKSGLSAEALDALERNLESRVRNRAIDGYRQSDWSKRREMPPEGSTPPSQVGRLLRKELVQQHVPKLEAALDHVTSPTSVNNTALQNIVATFRSNPQRFYKPTGTLHVQELAEACGLSVVEFQNVSRSVGRGLAALGYTVSSLHQLLDLIYELSLQHRDELAG